jgi:hypothetical protein
VLNERDGLRFGAEHCRQRVAAALANDHDNLALAVLVLGKATVATIFLMGGCMVNYFPYREATPCYY